MGCGGPVTIARNAGSQPGALFDVKPPCVIDPIGQKGENRGTEQDRRNSFDQKQPLPASDSKTTSSPRSQPPSGPPRTLERGIAIMKRDIARPRCLAGYHWLK